MTLDEKTAALLKKLLPDFAPAQHWRESRNSEGEEFAELDLPTPYAAEYFFRLTFYSGVERQISAVLTEPPGDYTYFWYLPYELSAFRFAGETLMRKFLEELEALLTHDTRIIQRCGRLFWHFRCEYRAAGHWEKFYQHSALKALKFAVPPIQGKEHIYRAARLANPHRHPDSA